MYHADVSSQLKPALICWLSCQTCMRWNMAGWRWIHYDSSPLCLLYNSAVVILRRCVNNSVFGVEMFSKTSIPLKPSFYFRQFYTLLHNISNNDNHKLAALLPPKAVQHSNLRSLKTFNKPQCKTLKSLKNSFSALLTIAWLLKFWYS